MWTIINPEINCLKLVTVTIIIMLESIRTSFCLLECDFEKYPESGCDKQLMTKCDTVTQKCTCRTGYPIEVNGRCFEYKNIGEECITSSQCFKAKCVEEKTQNEIISEEGTENHRIGLCRCTEDRFFHSRLKECVQRFITRKCFFNHECSNHRDNSYCDRTKCYCRPGFFYDYSTDQCLSNPLKDFTPCHNGVYYVYENGTQKCIPLVRTDTKYPYFRRPHYVNFMWPVFAFVLVILMFKLLKEGLERECPYGPSSSVDSIPTLSPMNTGSGSGGASGFSRPGSVRILRPSSILPHHQLSSTGVTSSRQNRSSSLNTTQNGNSGHNRRSTCSTPSVDTIVSLPPPYESQVNTPCTIVTTPLPQIVSTNLTIPPDDPPSYEEATRTTSNIIK